MAETCITDTGPPLHLHQIDHLRLLLIFDRMIISSHIEAELRRHDVYDELSRIAGDRLAVEYIDASDIESHRGYFAGLDVHGYTLAAETPSACCGEEPRSLSCATVDIPVDNLCQWRYIISMKLTIRLKLMPTDEQAASLLDTLSAFNAACNYVSAIAYETKTYNRVYLHKASYYAIRETFGLSAQMAVRAIGRIVETYKRDKNAN